MTPLGPQARSVSIVIPVRNRPRDIADCLDSLKAMDRPHGDLEVLVVDDASTDETPSVIAEHADGRVRLVAQREHQGQSACRNIGIAEARGDVVAFIDSDCLAHPGWIRGLLGEFDDAVVVASGGRVRGADRSGWLKRYEDVLSPLDMGRKAARVQPGTNVDFLPSCNLAARKDDLTALGGFDPTLRFGEDVDLVWRLCARGEVRYQPEAVVWHRFRGQLHEFVATRIRYASAMGMFQKRYPSNRPRLHVPIGLIVAAISAALGFTVPGFWAAAVGIPVLELIASVALRGGEGLRRTVRAYAGPAYQLLSIIVTYYALPLIVGFGVAAAFWTPATLVVAAIAACVVLVSLAEWVRRRPRLDPVRFLLAYAIDRFSTNVGVLNGCVAERTVLPLGFRPVVHALAWNVPDTKVPIVGSSS